MADRLEAEVDELERAVAADPEGTVRRLRAEAGKTAGLALKVEAWPDADSGVLVLRQAAKDLLALADLVESGESGESGFASEGGTGDRVLVQVVGPDGEEKQRVET